MKSQATSRKKLPIMGSCTNTRNFDTGQIDATNRQLLHSSRPQIDMKTTRRITMRYTIYIETLRVKRLYHLIAHFEIVGADRRPHRNIQIRRNRTIHINHLIRSTVERYVRPCLATRHEQQHKPYERHRKAKRGHNRPSTQLSRHSDNRSSQHRHRLNKLFVLV